MDVHCFEPSFSECPYHGSETCIADLCKDTLKLLQEQKRVGVVRCKDCKKRDSWECWQYFFGRIKIPDDWFCADGVKKDDGG